MQELQWSNVTPSSLDAYLTVLLAGRAAEGVLLGEVSSGAGGSENSDLAKAIRLAAGAELCFGLRSNLTWYGNPLTA